MKYVQATTLKGSAQDDKPTHAVPADHPNHDARSVCGVSGLAVFESGGVSIPFDPDDPWACKRCARSVEGAES